jgi:membrane-associated protease RseP (regulator of RpoE activity)
MGSPWVKLAILLLFVATPLLLIGLLGSERSLPVVWITMMLLISLVLMWSLFRHASAGLRRRQPEARPLPETEQPGLVREIMNVEEATELGDVQVFRGRLLQSAAAAYQRLKGALSDRAVPLLRQDSGTEAAIVLAPKQAVDERPVRLWLHWLLFGLTVLTTTFAGAAHQGVNLLREPERFAAGLPYSLALLAILGCHEMGHYLTARRHGISVTPPYFIPVPFALGTFGAFISMRAPAENRRQLLDVAVAGPLAGLVIAIPALYFGLQASTVLPAQEAPGGALGGGLISSSILFKLMSAAALGDALQYGAALRLGPLAFAGWLGLLVTALNLLPIGQLDGGHIARAMFGTRAGGAIGQISMWALLLLALFVWPALMTWALIVFFLSGPVTPPLNDLTPLTPGRRALGYAAFAVLVLILAPAPRGWLSM